VVSNRDEGRVLTMDEVEDLWGALRFAEKLSDNRAIGVCLDAVHQQLTRYAGHRVVDEAVLWRIIGREEVGCLETNRMLAQEILKAAQEAERVCDQGIDVPSL